MLVNLSVEVLEEIGGKLSQKDHANLRAVCKDLDAAMRRLFFSCLVLRLNQLRSESGLRFLKALATGETGWSSYARTLRMKPGKEDEESDISDTEMQSLLASTLRDLVNIDKVVWGMKESSPEWQRRAICDFLNGLPALEELQLLIQGTVDLSSLRPSGIRKMTIKNPSWGRGAFHFGVTEKSPMYQDLSKMIAQNRLASLRLEASAEWETVWSMLRAKTDSRSHLTEITTSVVTPELFAYLTSYSGLRKLSLIHPDGGSREASDRLADMFFETVLPHHAASLVELSCAAGYESRWSFGTHNVDVISQLDNLKTLEMSINAGESRLIDPSEEEQFIDPESGEKYMIARIGISVEIKQADIYPTVGLLLNTAATLPKLLDLTIASAETESNRGAWCGNGRIHHTGAVEQAIEKAIQTFTSNVPCPAIVRAGYHAYQLHPVNVEGLIDAKSRSGQEILLAYRKTGTLIWC
ncbi:hypothetical protein B0H11DRAFT_2008761 [Mycena galericulata]|nr:hypothetical protein B0H11DRAFT_2008761 [Mycena galericulata]